MSFGRRAVLFLGMLACVLAAAEWLIAWAVPVAEARKYAALLSPEMHFETIALGTSHGVEGLDPVPLEAQGVRLYNFAYHGAGPGFYADWYPLYRRHQPAPKRVLMLTDWFMFKAAMWRRIEHDSAYLPPGEVWRGLFAPGTRPELYLLSRFLLVRNRLEVQAHLLNDRVWDQRDMARYDRGFAPLRAGEGYRGRALYQGPDQPAAVAAFEGLLRTWRQDGTRVLFVHMPEYLPEAGAHPEENARIVRLAAREGIAVLNYNEALATDFNRDRAMFNDWGHLNMAGARRFSERLAIDLKRQGW